MMKAKLTHNNAQFSPREIILQKLIYPLAATTFIANQCATIMRPVLYDGLPRIQHGQPSQDTTSTLIQAMAEALKLESSICGKFLEIPLVYRSSDGYMAETYLSTMQVVRYPQIHISPQFFPAKTQ